MYTTITRVRTLSWLDDSTNIPDENIKSKIIIASWMVDSAIGYVYSIPVAYRFYNSVTFSWTATSSWTLTIIINGVTYNASVTTGATASAIADIFRISYENSADFLTDSLWGGAEVGIVSKTNSSISATDAYNEVSITSADDGFWITTSIWTKVKRFPVVLEQITAEIATALLFIDIYWVESQDTGKDWPSRMDRVNETLQKLQWVHESWQSIKIFDEVTNMEIWASTNGGVVSYPNDTSNASTTDSTAPKIFINKVF